MMIVKKDFVDLTKKYSYAYNEEYVKTDKDWQKLIELYNNFELNSENNIPKIIHQIWLGSKVPDKYKRIRDSWKIYHPDWEYKLWTDEDVKSLNFVRPDIFNKIRNLGMKSDLLRIEILNKFGGLYIDTDFECLKPMDDFNKLSFYASMIFCKKVEITVGIIAGIPNHPIFIDYLRNVKYLGESYWLDIFNSTGPYYFTEICLRNINENKDMCIFPTIYFFPYHPLYLKDEKLDGSNDSDLVRIKDYITSDSYATHWWHQSWLKSQ